MLTRVSLKVLAAVVWCLPVTAVTGGIVRIRIRRRSAAVSTISIAVGVAAVPIAGGWVGVRDGTMGVVICSSWCGSSAFPAPTFARVHMFVRSVAPDGYYGIQPRTVQQTITRTTAPYLDERQDDRALAAVGIEAVSSQDLPLSSWRVVKSYSGS